jgi:hypothetical protein
MGFFISFFFGDPKLKSSKVEKIARGAGVHKELAEAGPPQRRKIHHNPLKKKLQQAITRWKPATLLKMAIYSGFTH